MTVGELIEELRKLDETDVVAVAFGDDTAKALIGVSSTKGEFIGNDQGEYFGLIAEGAEETYNIALLS